MTNQSKREGTQNEKLHVSKSWESNYNGVKRSKVCQCRSQQYGDGNFRMFTKGISKSKLFDETDRILCNTQSIQLNNK